MRLFRTWMLTTIIGLAAYAGLHFCVVGQWISTFSGGGFCGDGIIQESYPSCGDGKVDPGESCDIWSLNGSVCDPVRWGTCTYCSSECTTETVMWPSCGDGIINGNEQCDDGNRSDGDACSSTCQNTFCGDGEIQAGESCDNGANNGAVCNPGSGTCTYCAIDCSSKTLVGARCGNGQLESGESCDDGNTAGWDGCSATCVLEPALLDTGAGLPAPKPARPVRTIQPLVFGGNYAPPALPSTGPESDSTSDFLGTPVVAPKSEKAPLIMPTIEQIQLEQEREEEAMQVVVEEQQVDNVDVLDHWTELNPGLGKTL